MNRITKLITIYFLIIFFIYVYLFKYHWDSVHYSYSLMYRPFLNINNDFDFFLLSITYPTSYCLNRLHCTEEQIKYLNKNFNIHGLWANNYDGSYPSYCSKVPFNQQYIDKNSNEFKKYWSTFNNNLEYSFYEHEWTKHGTCSNSSKIYDNESYFSNTINLMKEYHILDCLKISSIVPSNINTYTTKEIKDALYKCYPYSCNINCDISGNKNYLSEIHFYYSKDLEHIKFNYNDKCNNEIIIPILS